MRISIDREDQGYSPAPQNFGVTFNGKPVIGAITADEELGILHIAEHDARGDIVVRVLLGTVKIERVH